MPDTAFFRLELFGFLRQLKRHNNRDQFANSKAQYEKMVLDPALMSSASPERASLFRIYCDTRFSPDSGHSRTRLVPQATKNGKVLSATSTLRESTMPKEVSTLRLYLMRALYLLNFVLGVFVWPEIIKHEGLSDPLQAVAISFWAALFALSGLGLRYPLKMLPLLFMQLFYKSVWLMAVALPLWRVGRSADLTDGMVIGVVLDLAVIPWPYVLANYVKARGDRWRGPGRAAG